MSRGLGHLQVEIIETLDQAKNEMVIYSGGAGVNRYGLTGSKWEKPGWVYYKGAVVRLADGVYDLRASLKYLAQRHDRTYCRGAYVESSFAAAFSRATKSLLKRGQLTKLTLVPIAEYDGVVDDYGQSGVLFLADGLYLNALWSRQVRFVTKNSGYT